MSQTGKSKKCCVFCTCGYVFDKAMVVRQTSKTVYLAVVILQETELGINKSGTFVHLRLCKKKRGKRFLTLVTDFYTKLKQMLTAV